VAIYIELTVTCADASSLVHTGCAMALRIVRISTTVAIQAFLLFCFVYCKGLYTALSEMLRNRTVSKLHIYPTVEEELTRINSLVITTYLQCKPKLLF